MKILIIDDNAAMREMIGSFLPESFDKIRECAEGSDALVCYRSFHPDWVIINWEMKQIDGLVVTRWILSEFPDARILLITQHEDQELVTAALKAGARGLVVKDDLLKLRSWLTNN